LKFALLAKTSTADEKILGGSIMLLLFSFAMEGLGPLVLQEHFPIIVQTHGNVATGLPVQLSRPCHTACTTVIWLSSVFCLSICVSVSLWPCFFECKTVTILEMDFLVLNARLLSTN
jgi:hypothetical protein